MSLNIRNLCMHILVDIYRPLWLSDAGFYLSLCSGLLQAVVPLEVLLYFYYTWLEILFKE